MTNVPSLDGFPAEWYKMFWGKLKDFYFEVVKESLEEGYMHQSARTGILSLLEKSDQNSLKIEQLATIVTFGNRQ